MPIAPKPAPQTALIHRAHWREAEPRGSRGARPSHPYRLQDYRRGRMSTVMPAIQMPTSPENPRMVSDRVML